MIQAYCKHVFIFCSSLMLCTTATLPAAESMAQQTSKDFTTVAKKAIPAVVSIKVKTTGKQNSKMFGQEQELNDLFGDEFFKRFFSVPKQGRAEPVLGQASGFIISPDGLILTNTHVVQDASEILVSLDDGRELNAKVVGLDPNTEVALIKIDADKLPYLPLGDSDKLEIGEWVIAIGSSLGLNATLTVGVVSAKGRNNLDLATIEDFIQTDAAINRGNSGGPLLNLTSEVIGMNTAIATSGGSGYIGVGFAIPSNLIKHVVDQLKKTGSVTRGFIGVTMQPVDHDLAQAFGLKQATGALVTEVSKGSPAEKAGIRRGDIIQGINNQSIATMGSLRNALMLLPPGTKISLSVVREGNSIKLPIEVGTYPTSTPQTVAISGNQLGFDVQDLTPDLAKSLGITEERGVVIKNIDSDGPAAWAGLKKGTLIISVNHKNVSSVEQFNKALQEAPAGKPVLLLVKQGDVVLYISLKTAK